MFDTALYLIGLGSILGAGAAVFEVFLGRR